MPLSPGQGVAEGVDHAVGGVGAGVGTPSALKHQRSNGSATIFGTGTNGGVGENGGGCYHLENGHHCPVEGGLVLGPSRPPKGAATGENGTLKGHVEGLVAPQVILPLNGDAPAGAKVVPSG